MTYALMRWMLRLALRGFFRSVEVQGAELIPEEGPVLFVANHTNAFVDPLVVLTGVRRRVTITAKATLAGNPLLAPVIRALGVVLLHRASDAAPGARTDESPREERNAAALAACRDILRSGGAVFLFPEGVSHSDPALRPFRTGAARLVADVLAAGTDEDVWIVPVGLHFTKKDRWRSEALALVGEPRSARAFALDTARGTPGEVVDVRGLTDAMRAWIEELTVNFSSEEERTLLSAAERLMRYRPGGPGPLDREAGVDARARVALVHRLQRGAHELRVRDPERFHRLARDARALRRKLDALGVAPHEVSLSMHPARAALFVVREIEVLVVGAPFAFAGWLAHLAPLTLTRLLVRKLSADEDHPASNAVFLSLPIFGLWWLACAVAAAWFVGPALAVVLMAAVWFGAAVHLRWRDRVGGVLRRIRTFLLWLRRPDHREGLEAELVAWQAQLAAAEAELSRSPSMPAVETP